MSRGGAAGFAFASGMVVDNAIVVVENVFRHVKELGKPLKRAARDATVEAACASGIGTYNRMMTRNMSGISSSPAESRAST